MRYRVVLFDLDGTLVDSGAMILESMRHATRTVLGRVIPDDDLRAAVGGPGLVAQMRALDESRSDDLVRVYREHNEPLHRDLQACDGIFEVLEQLAAQERRLGIVTAKRRATVQLAFDVLPLARYFDVVVTSDDTPRHKPHPDPLRVALRTLGGPARHAVYVGDSPFDVQAAKAAGMASIAVAWGGIHSAERLAREEPDAVVATPEELLVCL